MFSPSGFKKANAYRQVGAHAAIEGASPHMLIQMLFDGLFQSLNAARGSIERHSIEEKTEHISKAIRILQEGLTLGLDIQRGGELAANLKLIYDYSVKLLTQANLRNDAALVVEVISVIQPIAQSWRQIGPNYQPTEEEIQAQAQAQAQRGAEENAEAKVAAAAAAATAQEPEPTQQEPTKAAANTAANA